MQNDVMKHNRRIIFAMVSGARAERREKAVGSGVQSHQIRAAGVGDGGHRGGGEGDVSDASKVIGDDGGGGVGEAAEPP